MKFVRGMVMAATLCVASSALAASWEDVGVLNGVHVWRREEPATGVMSFKGEITTDVQIGKLVAVFADRNQRKYWVDRYADSKTIEKPGPLSELYWIKFKLPFPISDRDYVLRADGVLDADKRVFTANIKSVSDARKGNDDCCVRATVNRTFYRFTALKGGKTKLEVEVNTDPKGLLPNWLVNLIQKEWPSKTLNGLLKRVRASDSAPMVELADWHD